MNRLSFRLRLLLGFVLVAVLPLAGLAGLYLRSFERALTQTVLLHVASAADKKAGQIDDFIRERIDDAKFLVRGNTIIKALNELHLEFRQGGLSALSEADRRYRADIRRQLDTGQYNDLLLIDAEGNIVFSLQREHELGSNLDVGPFRESGLAQGWRQAMQSLQTDLTEFSPYASFGDQAIAFVVAPVFDQGRPAGALALQINSATLTEVVTDLTGLGKSGESVVAMRNGEDVVFTAPLRHISVSAFRYRLPLTKVSMPMQLALSGEHGRGITYDYAGIRVASAWRFIPSLRWGMVVKIDTEQAFAPVYAARRFIWLALVAFILLSGTVAFFFGRTLSRPIAALTLATTRIAAGDLSQRVPVAGGSELAILADSFNRMADQVAAARTGLEAEVSARTRELQELSSLQRAILDNAAYSIIATTPDGIITSFNLAAERMLGYSSEEMLGRQTPAIFHDPEEVAARARLFAPELGIVLEPGFEVFVVRSRRNLPNEYEWTYIRKDGHRFPVLLSITALRDEQGNLTGFLGISVDITERKRAEELLRLSHEQLNAAQRIAAMGSWSLDLRTKRLEWSDEIFRIFEIDPERFGASYEAFLNTIHPEDRELVNRAYTDSLANRQPYEIIHRLLFPDGRIKHVNECGETLYDEKDGTPVLSRGTVQDITKARQAEESLHLFANVFSHSGEGILITDSGNRIIAVNKAFTHLTGYTIEELRGKNPKALASGRTPPETYQAMWAALKESGFWQGELWDRRKDGSIYPKWAAISVIRNPDGKLTHHIASFTDISERKAAEERIHHLAHHDVLTGLYNRFSLEERLEQAILSAHREHRELAVIFIDMDRFKIINDTLGHHVGDLLLIEVAQRLQASVRESDIVARLGGDEFVVVLTGVETGMTSGATIAGKILQRLGEAYHLDDHELHSSPSIGLSIYPSDGVDAELLMKNADTAMYHAKQQGRNNFQFFTTSMNKAAAERMRLEIDLRRAMVEKQFELHYQPQVLALDGTIYGVEALARWRHPEFGLIPPLKFIPVAEEIGLIVELGSWVLDEACRQLALWKGQGIMAVRMAVNLSVHQLRDPELVNQVRETMARHGIHAGELELEVTESVAMANPERAIGQLKALRELGVELAIDDFGTGYSSLAYLKLLPIQTLKLDRSFVGDIESDENDAAISAATLALARNLGLKVVAEGVETKAQRNFLADHQCDFLQGYLFGKPQSAAELQPKLPRTETASSKIKT